MTMWLFTFPDTPTNHVASATSDSTSPPSLCADSLVEIMISCTTYHVSEHMALEPWA